MSLIIKNGTAFINGKFVQKDIRIENSVISQISATTAKANADGADSVDSEIVDASGLLVLPGLIDPHVHLREPGDTYKEDFTTGSRAAVAGGFTTVIDMPNNSIPTITKERLDEKIRLAKEKAICDVFFHFGGTDNNFEEVAKANPSSMKLYLGQTTGMLVLKDPASLEKHFTNFPKDRQIVLHASDHSDNEQENLARTYATLENAVALAKKAKRKIHLAHASTRKEVEIAKKYRNCSVEVAPHYLFLSTADRERLGVFGKVYPPLRSEPERKGLWTILDQVDCIATDHAPHTTEDKNKGSAGFPGLETSLALMLTACERGLLDRAWVVERMTSRVAKTFSINDRGKLVVGFQGDITIVDPKKKWKVDGSKFETKCKWSPFEGMELTGKVHTVIKNGKKIFAESHVL